MMPDSLIVVFDVDDTLYLERTYVRSGFQAVDKWFVSTYGIDGLFEYLWSLFSAGTRGNVFDQGLARLGITPNRGLIESMVEIYRGHQPEIELTADALRSLETLSASHALAALTDGPVLSQNAKVRALDLRRWMNPIIVTGELGPGRGKPSTYGFELIQQRHGVSRRYVYVADNPTKDFAGPKALGWATVRVRRSEGLHKALPSGPDVDFEFADLTQLAAHFSARVT